MKATSNRALIVNHMVKYWLVPVDVKRSGVHMFGIDATLLRQTGVLFAYIAAPPMNLLGPALVRDLVSLIQGAFKSADPDYFIAHVDVTQIKGDFARSLAHRIAKFRMESMRSPSPRWRLSAAIPIFSARPRRPPRPKADSKLR